ncbi:MAG: DUF2252 domain-containing protein [Leptolyngbyaceae cyanobacterium SM2_5_2]|nr:DUF2252 domain-containing protein [Leptolyngbyaceae cyanobacterium SM2_5_2]
MPFVDDLAPGKASKYRLKERISLEERLAAGKALRQMVKRSAQGSYFAAENRDDPVAILEAQSATRVPELMPLRYARMLASPFAFLRGSAAVMIRDIAPAPTTGITVQACGDMHVSNFGVYASAERTLVFGINDFDETYPGPWEWDLKRLTASAVVAGRYLGGDRDVCQEAVRATVQAYQEHLQTYAGMSYLDLWYDTITDAEMLAKLPKDFYQKASRLLAKARERNNLQALASLTDLINDQHRLIESPPRVVRADTLGDEARIHQAINQLLKGYFASLSGDRRFLLSRYRIVDVARQVVGVGSVGTRCWLAYLEGKDVNDPLFLQIKQAQPSVLTPYSEAICGYRLPDNHQGHRVVIGQRLIQSSPDIFLGWGELDGHHYYVRQLRDMKDSLKLEPDKLSAAALPDYCSLCGWALALAHAKSGDAAMLAGYLGTSEALSDALVTFAEAYADQTEQDYETLSLAAKQGRIQVADDLDP